MCRPVFLAIRFLFADNFKFHKRKMTLRLLNIAFLILQSYIIQFHFTLSTPKSHQRTLKLLMLPTLLLYLFSFYRCSYAQLTNIPQYALGQVPQSQWCLICQNWQPERAGHCKACNRCILKSQGHSGLVANCVGFHNEKLYFLTCWYGNVMCGLFVAEMSRFFVMDKEVDEVWFCVIFVMGVLSIVLALHYTWTIINMCLNFWNNVTAEEKKKGVARNLPGCPRSLENTPHITRNRNDFDRLWMSNLCDIFGSSLWKWPLPIKPSTPGNGFCFKKIPSLDLKDIMKAHESTQVGESISEIKPDENEDDLKEYYDELAQLYKGKHLFFYTMRFDM